MVTEMTLKERITKMLKENTGTSFLDSGSAYGRNWERNQGRDFEKEPACTLEAENYNNKPSISITFNLWHYLNAYLDYDEDCEKLNKEFEEFCNSPEYKDEGYLTCMESWIDSRKDFSETYTTNTYNYDNLISQTIQYSHFYFKENDYILLQIHGGCDVRGGYTKPQIFKVPENDYFKIAQRDCSLYARMPIDKNQPTLNGIEPPKEFYSWDSDDNGEHWYPVDNEPKLEDVLIVKDDKAYINIGEQLLELTCGVMESY